MPKINVYLPDDLAEAVRAANLPVSSVCQRALEQALRTVGAVRESTRTSTLDPGRAARFTDRAKAALVLARGQAFRRGHAHLGTEHLLLGILDEGANLALRVLEVVGVDPTDVRAELEAVMSEAVPTRDGTVDEVAFTPRAIVVCQLATREALRLGHNYVGCEHLLLSLVDEGDGIGGQVLRLLGVELTTTRRAVASVLAGFVHARRNPAGPPAADPLAQILDRLDRLEQRLVTPEA